MHGSGLEEAPAVARQLEASDRTIPGLLLCSPSAPPAPHAPGSYSDDSVPGKTAGSETSPALAFSLQETAGWSPNLGEPHVYLLSKNGDKRDLHGRLDAENLSQRAYSWGLSSGALWGPSALSTEPWAE